MFQFKTASLPSLNRYQPGNLNSSSQTEKLVELVEGEKVAVSGGDSGDEYGMEMEDRPLQETFTAKLLFCPSGKIPTKTSGMIVYVTTAVICKCSVYLLESCPAGSEFVFFLLFSQLFSSPFCASSWQTVWTSCSSDMQPL